MSASLWDDMMIMDAYAEHCVGRGGMIKQGTPLSCQAGSLIDFIGVGFFVSDDRGTHVMLLDYR